MAGASYVTETRERTYRVWREQGQNVERTIRTMKREHDIPVTKPTLYAWIEKFDWKGRAARAETEERRVHDVAVTDEARILADLEKQRQKYERYFDSLGETAIDPQATYAYNSLAKTITDIRGRMQGPEARVDRPALFLESLEFIAGFLKEKDPEGLKVIAKNFDGLIEAFKEKHAQAS